MSLREDLTITFSEAVAHGTPEAKLNALNDLKTYIETHRDIWVGYDGLAFSIEEVIAPFTGGEINLQSAFTDDIADVSLTAKQRSDIEALGFEFKPKQTGAVAYVI